MRGKREARRRAIRRQIWLCGAILCCAFLIAAGARWLPQAAEEKAVKTAKADGLTFGSMARLGKSWRGRTRISGFFL